MPHSLQFSQVNPAASSKQSLFLPKNMKMPLFSDNSNVYYKPNSFSTGVGTVKNSRSVSKKT